MPRRLTKSAVADAETRGWVRALIRSRMALSALTYRDLAGLLTAQGLEENEGNLRSKVTRGELSAATLLAALHVMRAKNIDIESLPGMDDPDPDDRPTIDSALRSELISVKARDDAAGIYTVTVGKLRTPITITLESRNQAGSTVGKLSHVIRVSEESAPLHSWTFDVTPAKCLRRAIDQLTRVYDGAIKSGLNPSDDWVYPS